MSEGENDEMGAAGGIAASINQDADTPWARVCNKFKQEFGQQAYTTWLGQIGYNGLDGGIVELTAPTKFVRDWIQRNYGPRLMDFFHAEDKRVKSLSIRLAAKGAIPATPAQPVARAATEMPAVAEAGSVDDEQAALDPKYTFDSFVVGKSNELAYAAAKRIAESDEVSFNPLFLHGGVGLGKTHLMHAIAWEVKRRAPRKKVAYVSAEKFMFEFISAIRYKDTHAFKQKFRAADLLMVDDVQFIANKDSTQEEFFHTFNALIDNRCQLVITRPFAH